MTKGKVARYLFRRVVGVQRYSFWILKNRNKSPRIRGEAKENCWWGAKPQVADKLASFEPNLSTNGTFLEICQHCNVDEHF